MKVGEMPYKIDKGDLLCCIKNNNIFKKNKQYEVLSINNIIVNVIASYWEVQSFTTNQAVANSTIPYLSDYFIPLKQLRKLKLKQINESR